jgi:hypothetical protein
MYDSANSIQLECTLVQTICKHVATVCFRVTYLTPRRQAGLGSWFRRLPLGVPGPFALATGSLQDRATGGPVPSHSGWHSVTGRRFKPEFKFKLGPGVQLVDNYARNPVIP